MEPLPPPVQLVEVTTKELKQYDGSDPQSRFRVGDAGKDHACWERPEDMDTPRTASLVFRKSDPNYFEKRRCNSQLCEKEYHVGCQKEQEIDDLQALPENEWFCSRQCSNIHSTLQKLIEDGEQMLPEDLSKALKEKNDTQVSTENPEPVIRWRLLSGKRSSEDTRVWLSGAFLFSMRSLVAGKAVLCFTTYDDPSVTSYSSSLVRAAGGAGVIVAKLSNEITAKCRGLPCAEVDYEVGTQILIYIRSTRNPMVKISPSTTLLGKGVSAKIVEFSPRGPNSIAASILKVVYDHEDKFHKLADDADKDAGSSRLTLFSPCKINVFFRITGKRGDGYHDLVISLGDKIKFSLSPSKSTDRLSTNVSGVPLDDRNLNKTGMKNRVMLFKLIQGQPLLHRNPLLKPVGKDRGRNHMLQIR
ncbi:4-diphosphocytidyl-2-c-methyl-d-erythritol kinase chloroplastic/chromoplastic [Phtheirospermum japonicum]|uniref:4-diphosphocytidyl-2-c-methyl-d-erythritol kinase chloroplastic/chromoplastic n=1 Tax=Phtheirospermum japonicum TaxID=374723 RepID=A0A830B5V9_9LAMI|nr:4-diphosphocytidyl-2-c-methyl-d-erythritol kinase chloroplastic/chromoplastic [Phtheirospermum japonicum]